MNPTESARVSLIIRHSSDLALRAFTDARTSTYQNQAANGRLQSGSTVVAVTECMKVAVTDQVASLNSKIREVAKDKDAFDALRGGIEELIRDLEKELSEAVRLATGGRSETSVQKAAAELFAQLSADAHTELALLAFDYGNAPVAEVTLPGDGTPRPKGGRPPAEFWDDMWAAIATALYDGNLRPKTQADVERAMATWIEANGHSAADSTVRGRARRLWDRIAALDV